MKVALDVSQVVYGTGVSTYIRNIVPELIKLLDQPPTLFAGVYKNRRIIDTWFKETSSSLDRKVFPLPPKIADIIFNKLHLSIDPFIGKTDIFHSSDWTQPKTKACKVTTVHDLVAYKYPENLDPYIVKTQKTRMEWVKKECDLIIADSFATKTDLQELLSITESRIRVVHLAAAGFFKPTPNEEIQKIKSQFSILGDYLLCVGTREPRKNIQRVVEAFDNSELSKRGVELVLAGKYGWGEDIRPVTGVKILGFVDNSVLPELYSGAKAFLYPSLYEGFGVPILEAMACGCPVITSNRGSLKEIAGSSIIVDPESVEEITQAIKGILEKDEVGYNEIVKKGITNAQNYSWEKTASETFRIYKELT